MLLKGVVSCRCSRVHRSSAWKLTVTNRIAVDSSATTELAFLDPRFSRNQQSHHHSSKYEKLNPADSRCHRSPQIKIGGLLFPGPCQGCQRFSGWNFV